MIEVTLTIHSAGSRREAAMEGDRLLIGRAGARAAALQIEDGGLESRHASINRDGARVWVLDEGTRGGTFLTGARVPRQGRPLADGDEIFLGDQTTIVVRLRARASTGRAPQHASESAYEPAPQFESEPAPPARRGSAPQTRGEPEPRRPLSALAVAVPVLSVAVLVALFVAIFGGPNKGGRRDGETAAPRQSEVSSESAAAPRADAATTTGSPAVVAPPPAIADAGSARRDEAAGGGEGRHAAEQAAVGAKRYLQMSREEQLRFLKDRARRVSEMMGNRPYDFNDEVIGHIKRYVDVYARRVGNNSRGLWGEDLRFVFERARTRYAPHINRAFRAHGVPPVVGLYIVMIETEYHNFERENFAHAAGLFQFIPSTARQHGIDPSERTNVEKMAPAAARYMSARISEFGPDSMSVAIGIAGYNRNPDSLRRDLRDVIDGGANKERSFWTLVANTKKLDHWFQNENVKYVPKFFAAAIVGENPEAFGLEMRQLSTYDALEAAPEAAPEARPETTRPE